MFALFSVLALCRGSQPGSSATTLFLHDGDSAFSANVSAQYPWMRVSRVTDDRATLRESGGDVFLYDTLVVSDLAGTQFPIDEPYGPRYQTVEVETMTSLTAAQRRMTGGLSVKRILEFIDEGAGNLLLFTQSFVHEKLINELGFSLERPPSNSAKTATVYVPEVAGVSAVKLPEVESSTPRVFPHTKNVLAFPVIGDRVACTQMRNGARACVVVGNFATFPKKIVEALLSWISGERLWVKTANFTHGVEDPSLHKSAQGTIFKMYTQEQGVRFGVDVNTQEPRYSADGPKTVTDTKVFLEMTVKDKVIYRVRMIPSSRAENGWTHHETVLKMPDAEGVYKVRVKVEVGESRIGWNEAKNVADTITVRPLRHDDNSRFLIAGMPWYAAVFTSLLGTCVFTVFMAQELSASTRETKKTQ
jgi:hypothetical protein